jgi:uncharacterized protein with HEPN domain
VIRNFEIIGEAAKRIPKEFQNEHSAIPWRALAGFRDVLIHQYEGVVLMKFGKSSREILSSCGILFLPFFPL